MRSKQLTAVLFAGALALSACGGGGGDEGGSASAEDGVISLVGTDTLKYSATELTAPAGELTMELECEGAVAHNIVIEESDTLVVECDPGSTATGTVDLEAGTYAFYCSIPGHRSAGMEGTLTVS